MRYKDLLDARRYRLERPHLRRDRPSQRFVLSDDFTLTPHAGEAQQCFPGSLVDEIRHAIGFVHDFLRGSRYPATTRGERETSRENKATNKPTNNANGEGNENEHEHESENGQQQTKNKPTLRNIELTNDLQGNRVCFGP